MIRPLVLLSCSLALLAASPCRADLSAVYTVPADVPITASAYSASGTFSAELTFAPPVGTDLTVIRNTGGALIDGAFSNLAQGQRVTLPYQGINYPFSADYHGGTGNDLVLRWAQRTPSEWGNNVLGGQGSPIPRSMVIPRVVNSGAAVAGKPILSMATSKTTSLALYSDGTIGILGYLSVNLAPVSPAGELTGKTVTAVAVGDSCWLALCSDNTLLAWGLNDSGQLGNGTTDNNYTPAPVNTEGVLAGRAIVAISAGVTHNLALCADGTIAAWGSNSSGQLGYNTGSSNFSSLPVAVDRSGVLSGKTIVGVAAGNAFSLALCSDGTIASWGINQSGQLGRGAGPNSAVPALVSTAGVLSGKAIVAIAAGGSHSLALCSDSTLVSWGSNSYGQLGGGNSGSPPAAVQFSGALAGKTIVEIAAGQFHSAVRFSDGTMAAWGRNNSGQLGINSTADSSIPVAVNNGLLASGERYAALFSAPGADRNVALYAQLRVAVVSNPAAANLTKTSALLSGTVNPNGSTATARFEYGLDTTYGSTAPVTLAPADGATAQNVSVNLSTLTPGATYHYRLTATNALGFLREARATIANITAPASGG